MRKLLILILIVIVIFIGYKIHQNRQLANEQTENTATSTTTTTGQINKGDVIYTVKSGGVTRTYTVYVPESYTGAKEVPLIFVFHGGGSNAANVEKTSGFNIRAERDNFLVVYPLGTINKVVLGSPQAAWNGGVAGGGYAYDQGVDDIAFVKVMLKKIEADYKVDSNKIYSTGISMGGMLSYRIACEMSDIFAAVAPISATIAIPLNTCNPVRPIPVLHFHGTADRFIPYNGGPSSPSLPKIFIVGGNYSSVADSIATFKRLNKTEASGKVVYSKGDTQCVLYSGSADVELCTITDGGHTWPGAVNDMGFILNRLLGKTSQDISATDTMLEFFMSHPLK